MKTVFTNRELPHIWAHQNQPTGRGNNLFFDGPTIYSYGRHFPIARHVTSGKGERAILFTTRDYSVTTQKHKGYVRQACIGRVFQVPLTNEGGTLASQRKAYLDDYAQRITAAELTAGRARKYAGSAVMQLIDLVAEANDFAQFAGSRRAFTARGLDELREHAKQATARERVRKAAEQTRLERKHADAIREWLTGQRATLPWDVTRVYLRIVNDGHAVETSKGAVFPVEHAKRGLAFIEAIRTSGTPYARNGHAFHLGPYVIDKVDVQGNVTAGCHFVEWAQIEQIAEAVRAK